MNNRLAIRIYLRTLHGASLQLYRIIISAGSAQVGAGAVGDELGRDAA